MTLRIVVEDNFRIRGRGVIVAPALELVRVTKPATVTFEARVPEGATFVSVGRLLLEHLRLSSGGSPSCWVLVVDEACPALPRGTEIVATHFDPADALAVS